ncbi:MAG TPA: PaeR7I family type II restriction endonuclease, partial [Planctomycetaceae bacterium]|nr:PaeR7I family type II restriction endonuclease [Planctomycetaceae bacterium]
SYAKRYEILLTKLIRIRLYDGACLLLTTADGGINGKFSTPCPELSFTTFAAGLTAQAVAYAKMHDSGHKRTIPAETRQKRRRL